MQEFLARRAGSSAGLGENGLKPDMVTMDQATTDAAVSQGCYKLPITGFGDLDADSDQLRRTFAGSSQSSGFSTALSYHNPACDALAKAQVPMNDPAQRTAAVEET